VRVSQQQAVAQEVRVRSNGDGRRGVRRSSGRGIWSNRPWPAAGELDLAERGDRPLAVATVSGRNHKPQEMQWKTNAMEDKCNGRQQNAMDETDARCTAQQGVSWHRASIVVFVDAPWPWLWIGYGPLHSTWRPPVVKLGLLAPDWRNWDT